jgi:hypothetical protein
MTPSRSPFIDLQKGPAVEFGYKPLLSANAAEERRGAGGRAGPRG